MVKIPTSRSTIPAGNTVTSWLKNNHLPGHHPRGNTGTGCQNAHSLKLGQSHLIHSVTLTLILHVSNAEMSRIHDLQNEQCQHVLLETGLICSYFYTCVYTHSRRATLIVFLYAYVQCTFFVCGCVWEWMIDLATETLSNTTLRILPMHSLWNRSSCLIQHKIEEVEYDLGRSSRSPLNLI